MKELKAICGICLMVFSGFIINILFTEEVNIVLGIIILCIFATSGILLLKDTMPKKFKE